MRDPKKFFDLSKATSIVQALISFTMDKAEQLLVQPFMQILLSSPRFRRVKMEERLNFKQEEYPDEIFVLLLLVGWVYSNFITMFIT